MHVAKLCGSQVMVVGRKSSKLMYCISSMLALWEIWCRLDCAMGVSFSLWFSFHPSPKSPNPFIFSVLSQGVCSSLKKQEIQRAWELSLHYSRWSICLHVHNFIVSKENRDCEMPFSSGIFWSSCLLPGEQITAMLGITPLCMWGRPRLQGAMWE